MKLTILSLNHSRNNGFFLIEGVEAEAVMNRMIARDSAITWDSIDEEGATAIYNKGFTTTQDIKNLYKECK